MKSKKEQVKLKTGFKFNQDVLRIICYVGGGIALVSFPWYAGYPLLLIGILLGQFIENLNIRIIQIK